MASSSENQHEVAEEAWEDEKKPPCRYQLTCAKMLSYCHLRLVFSTWDLTLRPARGQVYIDALKMAPGTQAMLIAICKSLDFLIGFLVGKLSDATRTRFGRRKPFIIICLPIATLSFVLFCNPTLFFAGTATEKGVCSAMVPESDDDAICGNGPSTLVSCLKDAIDSNKLHGWNETNVASGKQPPVNPSLAAYFAFFYFFYYVFGWTCTYIPYDALSMELTDDGRTRSTLFATRTAFQFVGYALPIALQMGLNSVMASDVPLQFSVMSLVFGTWTMLALVNLLCAIKERPAPTSDAQASLPFVVALRRCWSNAPYRTYLLMKIPITISGLLPSNLVTYYVKFVMLEENSVGVQTNVSAVFLASSLLSIAPMVMLSRRIGRGKVLSAVLCGMGIGGFLLVCIPGTVMLSIQPVFYSIMCLFGMGTSAVHVLADPMLADVIDYDELITGARSEGIYTVVETNLQQFVEIVGGVLPLLLMEAAGYVSNAGCACGCGVSCDKELGMPYARWVCPNDIAYTCTGSLTSSIYFGGDRIAPCTQQNVAVQWVIRLTIGGLVCVCALLAMYPICKFPISMKVHNEVVKELARREKDSSHICTDPLTGAKIHLKENTHDQIVREHYSSWERQKASEAKDGIAKLKQVVGAQFVSFLALFIAIVIAVVASGFNINVVSVGALVCAGLLVIIPFQGLRLKLVMAKSFVQPQSWIETPVDSVAWSVHKE